LAQEYYLKITKFRGKIQYVGDVPEDGAIEMHKIMTVPLSEKRAEYKSDNEGVKIKGLSAEPLGDA